MTPVLHYIPHTHWEGAVFKTRAEYLEIGLPNILRALRLLEDDPDYRFTLDQSCYVRPFLERYPEEAERFRRFVREGRLAIVGGTHVMHDGNIPGPESYVRQIQYGKQYFRRTLQVDVTVGWQLDTFGHHAQTPQLLRLAGYGSLWFFRGVPSWETRSEFQWEALDGTRLPAYWLPHSYAVAYGSPRTPAEFAAFMQERYESLAPFTDRLERPGPAGADVCEPEEHVAAMVREMSSAGAPIRVSISVPQDFERAVPPGDDWPVVRGEMNPIFQGAYSSRIELKQYTRAIETLLTDAEALGAILTALGVEGHADPMWDAWEPMLFNQAHDLMSGVMTDHVYEDTLASYGHSRTLAEAHRERRLRAYAEQVDTVGDGIPLMVINTLAWQRTELVTAELGFGRAGVRGVQVTAPDGGTVPCQIVEAVRHLDGSLLLARVAFVARHVPAMGHALYRAVPVAEETPQPVWTAASGPVVLENDRLRVVCDAHGALTSLTLKDDDAELLSGAANVIAREKDEGDLWEPYRPLDGGSRIAMKERHPVADDALLSNAAPPDRFEALHGPVFSEVRVEGRLGDNRFCTVVRVVAGMDRIDVRTTILNNERFVRHRVLFPTSIADGRRFDEIPFGAIERPDGIEFPAQNWVDWSNGARGLALLNRGLPGANVADGALMLSLMRSTCIVAYGFGGGYEPGMSSDTGFELGKELAFEYALLPHSGDWREAALHRRGAEFNHPLLVSKAEPQDGPLPARWGFLQPLDPRLALTSLRPGSDGSVLLRLYEATGHTTDEAEVRLAQPVEAAWEMDLMDDNAQALPVESGSVRLTFRPFEIKTVKATLGRPLG
jgi:alpha-mannosidase